jgi:hypothetical protein
MKRPTEITKVSQLTGNTHTMTIMLDPKDVARWQQGVLIQDALPYLSPAEREFLMTGATDEEWEEMVMER